MTARGSPPGRRASGRPARSEIQPNGGQAAERATMETQFLGKRKAKLWTYLFLAVLLIVVILVVNLALVDPEAMHTGVHFVAGLPSWAFPLIGIGVGAFLFWIGLKVETDWPELFGAVLIAGGVAAGELMIGWDRFALGGLAFIPYAIPVAVFLILLIIAVAKSK
jgi:uncharacterized integral membrane protein